MPCFSSDRLITTWASPRTAFKAMVLPGRSSTPRIALPFGTTERLPVAGLRGGGVVARRDHLDRHALGDRGDRRHQADEGGPPRALRAVISPAAAQGRHKHDERRDECAATERVPHRISPLWSDRQASGHAASAEDAFEAGASPTPKNIISYGVTLHDIVLLAHHGRPPAFQPVPLRRARPRRG